MRSSDQKMSWAAASPTEAPAVDAEPARKARPRPPRRAVDLDAALRRETAHLAETRRLSVRDPKAALTLAERGHREFVGGMFREEREAIAIFALEELGRDRGARRR